MKIVGRIFLLIAAVCLIGFGVPVILTSVNYFNANGWAESLLNGSGWPYLTQLIGAGVNGLFGLVALLGAIFGRKSIKLALCAILMAIAPSIVVVQLVTSGTVPSPEYVWYFVGQYAIPLLYLLGFLFL